MSISIEPFFEKSLDIFCIADYNSHFIKVNPAFVNLLGYTEDELYAKHIKSFIYEEDVMRTLQYGEELRKSIPLNNIENRYVTKSGEIVWLHWTLMVVPEDKLIYGIAKDITYKKKLEAERVEKLFELDKKSRDLKTLNYKTSHDLRSPINNIQTLVDLIELDEIEDQQLLEIIGLIKESSDGLKQSLDDYVDCIEEVDNLDLKIEEINFESTFKKVQSSILALINDSRATFIFDFSEVENVNFNRSYMESILLNFITNSIKYARTDVAPIIKISSKFEGEKVKLIFSDNGLGFDMNRVQNKIFKISQKFHNLEDSKGVGLYLIHNYIKDLNGEIAVESKVNEGTTFTITF
ncbi:PAS domain-containing sensor histidine kinase [Cellulophaga baltica]|uniref:PAS domain-containing sensor histidine kinase n=1 Tax=Cellulophaga TaxID=104264 RepID=UPI001C07C3A9|nr:MULTISPECIES: PAS domain-containing sensor histidine kinase [Cellulophaga]MBU2997024.1 PAS domain-containing sensor histidine kinase [Cellulophaga baltica]MDO6768422.1 PAS domain-containing sensor histidine kinase [Cellulophaga sp. 1_MG-2023]